MSRDLVVDASVLAKLFLRDEELIEKADSLFHRFVQGELKLFAPRLVLYEVPASIRVACQRGRKDPQDGLQAVQWFTQLSLSIVEEPPTLIEEAFELSLRLGCALYDAVYLRVADNLSLEFVTADDRLYRQVFRELPYIRSLRNFT